VRACCMLLRACPYDSRSKFAVYFRGYPKAKQAGGKRVSNKITICEIAAKKGKNQAAMLTLHRVRKCLISRVQLPGGWYAPAPR
jgi:hypothetical protein